LPSEHENFHDDAVVYIMTLWMFPGLSVRKSGPAARKVSYAISLILRVITCSVVKVANQWQGSLYWERISIVAVLHKGCIAHTTHRWLSQGLTFHHPLKVAILVKCNCQNNKSVFAVHAVTKLFAKTTIWFLQRACMHS